MYWPKFSERKLFLLLKKQRKAKAGCHANYIRWTKYVGLKLFRKKHHRDRAYEAQSLASEHKLGPKCGDQLIEVELISAIHDDMDPDHSMVPVLQVQRWFGYFTEHCPAPPKRWSWDANRESQEMHLFTALQRIGIYHGDIHSGNVSFVRGKKKPPICIDFGPESCYLGKPRKGEIIDQDDLNWSRFL